MNKVRGAARLLVIVSIAVSGIGLAAAPATAAEPTLTVTPTTNLLDHHPVRVTGTGFVPGATYVIVDCTADACVDDDAYWLTMGALQTPVTPYFDRRRTVVAAPDGTISTSLRMSRTIYVGDEVYEDPSPDLRDCSAEPCTLAVVALADVADRLVEVPVSFQATGTYTWTPGTLTVDAPARLPDQGTVPVSGTGWDPGSYETAWWGDKLYGVKVEMCATGPGAPVNRCQLQAFPYPAVDHDGVVGADVRVDRFLDLTGGLWDCAAKPCALRIGQGSRLSPEVPVTFGAEWSPFASAGQMVDRLSIAVTGAVLPAAERNPLVSGLAGGTLAASSVLRTLVERPGAPSEVATLYASILQRRPDTAGLAFWVARRRAGTTAARIA
ncbi:MAG TPA: neocarzinostatin apoprotein domain-containing protein, partial [Iamia sp.]